MGQFDKTFNEKTGVIARNAYGRPEHDNAITFPE
jgi:hypothetical protein